MLRKLSLGIFYFITSSLLAQQVKVLHLRNGLSNNYVQCTLQDQQGFQWIGTRDGLNRYDGHHIETFHEQLASSFVYCMLQSQSGEVWIGTSQGGVTIFDPSTEKFRVLAATPTFRVLNNKDVYSLFEDQQHNLWIATLQGLGKIPSKRDTLYWYELRTGEDVRSFTSFCETTRDLYVGCSDGLRRLKRDADGIAFEAGAAVDGTEGVFVRDIIQDPAYRLMLATDANGVLLLDGKSTQALPTSMSGGHHNQVWDLFVDRHGTVWAGVINGGLFQYDEHLQQFSNRQKTIGPHFNSSSITNIQEDFNGNLWVSSHGDGVCYFNPHRYVFDRNLSGETPEQGRPVIVSAFFEDEQRNILIGTDGDGLKHWSNRNSEKSLYNTTNGLTSNIVLDVAEDSHHVKWLALWQGGVVGIDPNGKKTPLPVDAKAAFALRNSNVKSVLIDQQQNLWIASHGGGVTTYSTTQRKFVNPVTIFSSYQPGIAQWGSDLLQTRNGEMWIASHAGLFRLTHDSLHHYYAGDHPGGIGSSIVYCLFEDHEQNVWIGTSNSLERFDAKKNTFENYTRLYNVPGDIKCIRQGNDGKLWISTVHEIVSLNPQTKALRHFDESYNAQQGQFYECSCLKSSSGKLFFGGTEGFNAFWPDSLREMHDTTRLLITGLYIFGEKQRVDEHSVLSRSMSFNKEITLRYDQNVVSLEFLSINYAQSSTIRYSYVLEGFNDHWSPPSPSQTATYTNLDAGNYTFRVKAISLDGNVLSERSIIIHVVPPFWKASWFRVLAFLALLFVTVGSLLYRLYASKQKRLYLQQVVEERTREVREKNVLLEQQTADLQVKHDALIEQDEKIKGQALTLSEQRDQLQRTNATLQELVSMKNRLFSIVAHDLRNPFTSLLGYTKLLSNEYDRYNEDDRRNIIKRLHHASTVIYSLLDNLLVWSKAQQDELVFAPEKLSFVELMRDHFDLLREEAEKKRIALTTETAPDVIFNADRNMISVIIRNLLSNAVRYSPLGGRILAGYNIHEHGLVIFIQDDGQGVEDPASLFKNIGDRKSRDHNHGLGLMLCKEFVERHGGTIRVDNNAGKGACFTFTLPESAPELTANEVALQTAGLAVSTSTIAEGRDLPIVLIAEDDDDIRWYIRETLQQNFNVVEAMNGNDAWRLAVEHVPEIIVSDVNMPGLNGVDFCSKIKQHHQTSHIPFVMLTAERGSDMKISGFQHGADDYITKPVDTAVLRARIHNLLDTRKRLKAIYQQDITSEPASFTTNTVDQEFMTKLNDIIEKFIADGELSPDTLASEMNMSRTGLYMKVKALTGESVAIYVRNVRLKASRKMLRSGKMNVSEVAYAVGFNQLPYFTSCFKEAFGITPSEFAKTSA